MQDSGERRRRCGKRHLVSPKCRTSVPSVQLRHQTWQVNFQGVRACVRAAESEALRASVSSKPKTLNPNLKP